MTQQPQQQLSQPHLADSNLLPSATTVKGQFKSTAAATKEPLKPNKPLPATADSTKPKPYNDEDSDDDYGTPHPLEAISPPRDLARRGFPLTPNSRSPELSGARGGGIGGTVMNARTLEEKLIAMWGLDDHRWNPQTHACLEAGKKFENQVMLDCLKLKEVREKTGPLLVPRRPRVHYANYAIHPTFPPLRATPDFVIDGKYIVQCKRKAGSESPYPVHIHRKACEAKGDKTLLCSCREPPEYANQLQLEMHVSGYPRNDIAVQTSVDTDYIIVPWKRSWWMRVRPEVMELLKYNLWMWEDDHSEAATAPLRAFLVEFNRKVTAHNTDPKRPAHLGLRKLCDIDALFRRRALPDEVKAMKTWRMAVTPRDRPLMFAVPKRKAEVEEVLDSDSAPPPKRSSFDRDLNSLLADLFPVNAFCSDATIILQAVCGFLF